MRTLLVCILLAATAAPALPLASACSPQWVHSYAGGTSANVIQGGVVATSAAGTVTAYDTNAIDCDGDGRPDEDGDPDAGVGGGFLPADHHDLEAICVQDVVSRPIAFVVGIDGNSDGLILPDVDPADEAFGPFLGCATTAIGSTGCSWTQFRRADGSIDPNLDVGPAAGPRAASACAGIEGVWVFIQSASVVEGQTSAPPTAGSITG